MKRYAYKKLHDPSEKQINELGEQGWRVTHMAYGAAAGEYSTYKDLYVIMEREGEPFDPNAGRL